MDVSTCRILKQCNHLPIAAMHCLSSFLVSNDIYFVGFGDDSVGALQVPFFVFFERLI